MYRYLVAVLMLAVAYIESAPQPVECPDNESWDLCGHYCEATCFNPSPIAILCPLCSKLTAGCRCDHGYARLNNGTCVWVTQCEN